MMNWLKKVFGGAGVAAAENVAKAGADDEAALNDEWHLYIEAARDLSGGDAEIEALLVLARDNLDGLDAALDKPPYTDGTWDIYYDPGHSPPGSLFSDAMISKGLMCQLDWKEGSDEVLGHYDNQMARLSLPFLTAAQRQQIEAQDTIFDTDYLTFPDIVQALDADARTKGMRVLVFDDRSDSYSFVLATPSQFERWHAACLGPKHCFFSADFFVTDQSK